MHRSFIVSNKILYIYINKSKYELVISDILYDIKVSQDYKQAIQGEIRLNAMERKEHKAKEKQLFILCNYKG